MNEGSTHMSETVYVYGDSLKTVLNHLGPDTLLYAGGTSASFRKLRKGAKVIDLKPLGWDLIKEDPDGNLTFQSGVTIEKIRFQEFQNRHHALLHQICRDIAATPLRSMITVGGEVIQCPYWANLPVYFLAADAHLVFVNRDEQEQCVTIRDYYHQPSAFNDLFLSSVSISAEKTRLNSLYFNLKETDFDYSTFNYLILYSADFEQISIVLGGIQRYPTECTPLCAAIQKNKTLSSKDLHEYIQQLPIRNDIRYSAEYRLNALENTLADSLKSIGVIQ